MPQTRMMHRAGRVHGIRWAAGLSVVVLAVVAGKLPEEMLNEECEWLPRTREPIR